MGLKNMGNLAVNATESCGLFKIVITCDLLITVNFPSFKYIMNAANREILDGEHRRVFTLMKKVENFRCNAIRY